MDRALKQIPRHLQKADYTVIETSKLSLAQLETIWTFVKTLTPEQQARIIWVD